MDEFVTKFQVTGKLYLDSTVRRTNIVLAIFDTFEEAAGFVLTTSGDVVVAGESITIEAVEVVAPDDDFELGFAEYLTHNDETPS
jgi:hypothetical protein